MLKSLGTYVSVGGAFSFDSFVLLVDLLLSCISPKTALFIVRNLASAVVENVVN
jgi:hypothetical protein